MIEGGSIGVGLHTPMIPPIRHSLSRNVPFTAETDLGSGQFLGLVANGALSASFGQPESDFPCASIRVDRKVRN